MRLRSTPSAMLAWSEILLVNKGVVDPRFKKVEEVKSCKLGLVGLVQVPVQTLEPIKVLTTLSHFESDFPHHSRIRLPIFASDRFAFPHSASPHAVQRVPATSQTAHRQISSAQSLSAAPVPTQPRNYSVLPFHTCRR